MKGLNISISIIVALLVGIVVIVILGSILTGNISGLEGFAGENLEITFGGDSS